jgi:hypothetical protein
MVVPDMGHDLPHARMELLVDRIATHCEAAQRAADAPKAE